MSIETNPLNLPEELDRRRQIILRELRKRTFWFIQLRWFVPPSIVAGVMAGRIIGVKFAGLPLLLIAFLMLSYNTVFFLRSRQIKKGPGWKTEQIKRFTYAQVVLDYVSMLLLIHYTGGAASPLIFFFIFHIIFASILLPPLSAYGFAVVAAAGMAAIAFTEYKGWLPHHAIVYRDLAIDLAQRPFHMMVELAFFTASVFITAFSTTNIMPIFRKRISTLAELSEAVVGINSRLNALYVITRTISSSSRFQQVMDIVTSELASALSVKGVSIKLLSDDGKTLTYSSVFGLPAEIFKDKVISVGKSPLNQRIIDGEPYVIGNVTQGDVFQFGEDLAALGIKSALFLALNVEGKVMGILGAYSTDLDRFGVDELDFMRLAAGLVSVALENAQAFEAIEKLNNERLWFIMRVAHNLRSPLNANQSIITMMQDGYLGGLTENQQKYLARIGERSQAMITTLNELTTLAETRNRKRLASVSSVNLHEAANKILTTFRENAAKHQVSIGVQIPDDLPNIDADAEMIEQLFENLVSNSIKYTTAGGKAEVILSRLDQDNVQIKFSDTGIGIPRESMSRLFTEFFRAENAKQLEEMGTGLGLSIVRDIVTQHKGRISVESEEGKGTTFTVVLPVSRKA